MGSKENNPCHSHSLTRWSSFVFAEVLNATWLTLCLQIRACLIGESFHFMMRITRITSKRSFQQVIRNRDVSPFLHTHEKWLEASFAYIFISLLLTFFASFFQLILFQCNKLKWFLFKLFFIHKKFTVFLNLILFTVFLNRNPIYQPNGSTK